jgi:hypothetical protein
LLCARRSRRLDTTVAIDHLRGEQAAVDILRGLGGDDETVAPAKSFDSS